MSLSQFSLPSSLPIPIPKATLHTLLAALLLYYLHKKLSSWTLNNFQPSEKWISEKELVLLTGGSGAIGHQITKDLSSRNIRTIILDITPPPFPLPDNVTFYQTDITSSTSIAAAAAAIRDAYGDPTVIMNNAGVADYSTILSVTEPKLRQIFDVNILAHFLVCKEFLPAMIRANHGHVITTASIASFVTSGEMVHYACTKAGAMAFHEGLRQELKHWYKAPKIRTSVVHPFWVQTPMIKGYTDYQSEFRQPIMSPEVVSRAVVDHVVTRQSGEIILPRSQVIAAFVRSMPVYVQEAIRSYFSKVLYRVGLQRAMDEKR